MKKDKCANCGGTGDVSVSVPCPECRPNAARNATRDRKRAEMFGEIVQVAALGAEVLRAKRETGIALNIESVLAKAKKLL